MKRHRQQIRVNPIDTMPNTAVGISLPFNSPKVFTSTFTTADQVKSNLINYFLTNKGERFFNPNFGGDLRAFVFEQTPEFDQLQSVINSQLEIYFPMISVVELKVLVNTDNYTVTINLSYSANNISDNVSIQLVA